MNRFLVFASLLMIAACSAKHLASESDQTRKNDNSTQPARVAVEASVGPGPGGLQLRSYEFDTVTIDSNGAVTGRRKAQARYYVEDLKGVGLEMVEIPGGTFTMGSSGDGEQPLHQVTASSFYIGKYEVTQAQWKAVASLPKVGRDLDPDTSFFKGDNLPVDGVSWKAAMEFCARISRATGRSYRLPSEAEWEYAGRAGARTEYAFGESITPELVNYKGVRETWDEPKASASKGVYRAQTTPVGSLGVANGFGLYDIHGNVAEWCLDYHQIGYVGAPKDGSSWRSPLRLAQTKADEFRIVRGGSWLDGSEQCRVANRGSDAADSRKTCNGFRVVEQQPGRKRPPDETPWRVSDKANQVVEAFLAADKTHRLLSLADIPKSRLEFQAPSKGPVIGLAMDIQQVDMPGRAIAEGDVNDDRIEDALAIVVRGEGGHKLFSVICFNGRKGGYNPAPFWILKDSADFIGKIYVEEFLFDQKYKYRTPPTVYVVNDLDFSYERSDNDFYTWNGAQYEQGYFVAGEHLECSDDVKLFSLPNPSSKVVKVVKSETVLLVLSAVPIGVARVEGGGERTGDSVRWYRVQALKNNRRTEIIGFVAGDQVTRWAEEH